MNRRSFVALGAASALAACARPGPSPAPSLPEAAPARSLPAHYGAITGEPFPIPAIDPAALPPEHWRREIANPWPDRPRGDIVVDPDRAVLHFVESRDRAMRYSCSVGARGFDWEGTARLQFRRKWPRWKVPETMIAREPELAPYSVANGGMDPGPGNPLGARALYLFRNGKDTLYRVHGDADPEELGHPVSSGCIRMLNHDVIDLYERAVHGASVTVLPSMRPKGMASVY